MTVLIPITVELFYSGVWNDITSYVRAGDKISITRGRQNEGTTTDPATCNLSLNNRDGRFSPRNPTSPLYGLIGRNTQIRVKATPPGGSASIRFVGEVSSWPVSWDVSGTDIYVPITAAGILRRLGQGQISKIHTLAQWIAANASPVRYWPLVGTTQSTGELSTSGKKRFAPTSSAVNVQWGQGDLGSYLGSALGVNTTSTGSMQCLDVAGTSTISSLATMDFVYKCETMSGATFTVSMTDTYQAGGSGIFQWTLNFRPDGTNNDIQVQLTTTAPGGSPSTVNLGDTAPLAALTDGQTHYVRLALSSVSSPDTTWIVYVDGVSVATDFVAGQTVSGIEQTKMVYTPGSGGSSLAFGHLALYNSTPPTVTNVENAVTGFPGEAAGTRISRVCSDNSVTLVSNGTLSDTALMGPQSTDAPITSLLQDAADADLGILYEDRSSLALAYRTRNNLYNQAASVTLDYSANVFADALNPTDDDQNTANDVTVTNWTGGSAEESLTSGALSTLDPPNGVDPYPKSYSVNLQTDGPLADYVSWKLSIGTLNEARYPSLHVNLVSPEISGNATLAANIAATDVTSKLTITNLPAWLPPDSTNQLVMGYSEELWQFGWDITFNCIPESPYEVAKFSAAVAGTDRFDAENSTLDVGCTSGATSLSVKSDGELWTTVAGEFPFDINITGERITVTNITGGNPAFVGKGTASTGNNASVTPGLPTGAASGDTVLIFASIRSSGTGTVNLPTNWTDLTNFGNVRIMSRVYDGVWTMPTVTFTGGAAGDDTIGQSAAFRNVVFVNVSQQLNGSAQNIALPSTVGDQLGMQIFAGWKQDDWTTADIASNLGNAQTWVEIEEQVAIAGNDAGQVWDYRLNVSTAVDSGQFTIVGGASAISRGIGLHFKRAPQTFTVTRSVNGVVKAHSANDKVQLWKTPKFAL